MRTTVDLRAFVSELVGKRKKNERVLELSFPVISLDDLGL